MGDTIPELLEVIKELRAERDTLQMELRHTKENAEHGWKNVMILEKARQALENNK